MFVSYQGYVNSKDDPETEAMSRDVGGACPGPLNLGEVLACGHGHCDSAARRCDPRRHIDPAQCTEDDFIALKRFKAGIWGRG